MSKGVHIVKATGVVRRLDDLGRLVIPKEIRKQYRLKEGDSIEFFIEDDKIIIQKFDVLSRHMEEIEIMVETLEAMYQNPVLFLQEEWLHKHHKEIDENFFKAMHLHRITNFKDEKVFQNEEVRYQGIVFPIIAYGDWFGAFVMLFTKEEKSEAELQGIEAFCKLLTRQQEQ